jgi:hypothetical protein
MRSKNLSATYQRKNVILGVPAEKTSRRKNWLARLEIA